MPSGLELASVAAPRTRAHSQLSHDCSGVRPRPKGELGWLCLGLRVRPNGFGSRKTRRLRSVDYGDSPPGGARISHGGVLVWAVLASSPGHGAGRSGRPGQRVPAGVGGAGHACDLLQAAVAVVGVKSPGHPAGVGVLREHGDRAVSSPRSGRPERIHT